MQLCLGSRWRWYCAAAGAETPSASGHRGAIRRTASRLYVQWLASYPLETGDPSVSYAHAKTRFGLPRPSRPCSPMRRIVNPHSVRRDVESIPRSV